MGFNFVGSDFPLRPRLTFGRDAAQIDRLVFVRNVAKAVPGGVVRAARVDGVDPLRVGAHGLVDGIAVSAGGMGGPSAGAAGGGTSGGGVVDVVVVVVCHHSGLCCIGKGLASVSKQIFVRISGQRATQIILFLNYFL